MSTIREHISALRVQINKYDDDSRYTDEGLYHFLKAASAIWNQRQADKFDKISDFDYADFCVALEKCNIPGCDDCFEEDEGCSVLCSTIDIPPTIGNKNRDLLKIYTAIDRVEIGKTSGSADLHNYDPILSSSLLYDIINSKIVVYNGNADVVKPRKIVVRGFWEDITAWSGLAACDPNSGSSMDSCYDILDNEFPLDSEYVLLVYDMVLKSLGYNPDPAEVTVNNKNYAH